MKPASRKMMERPSRAVAAFFAPFSRPALVLRLVFVLVAALAPVSSACAAKERREKPPKMTPQEKAEAQKAQKEKEKREKEKRKRREKLEKERQKTGKSKAESVSLLEMKIGEPAANTSVKNFAPFRTKPRFTGEFLVDVVAVSFPDCEDPPSVSTIEAELSRNLKEYYMEYSQCVTWPRLAAYPVIYSAPHPYGYYCRYHARNNRIGFKDPEEGSARVAKLKRDAREEAQKAKASRGRKPALIMTWVYVNALSDERIKSNDEIRDEYPKPDNDWEYDLIVEYKPEVPWADPLWPNSSVQVNYPSGALIHELGHVLGAPDFYHSSEEHDGIPGSPDLYSYGPTGPAYCRYIYHAFASEKNYPTYTKDGVYTLDRRSAPLPKSSGGEEPVLGCFIPSAHPNYVFQLEYAHNDVPPVGNVREGGLLINVINVTRFDHMLGSPDLCYTYRRGDPTLKGQTGSDPFLRPGDRFDLTSDPAAIIPPLIPAGIEITDISFSGDKCSFSLHFTKTRQDAKFLKDSLLPSIRLTGVDELMPTSFRASCEILYRGEPLLDEYGFVWDTKPDPVIGKNKFPLHHRDRYDARILGLKPGGKYFLRAYVKNKNGVTYSEETLAVELPKSVAAAVPPLITDGYCGNKYITRDFWAVHNEELYRDSANAIIALMSLGVYYGTIPGEAPKGEKPIYLRGIHTNPADTRPKFRLADYHKYFNHIRALAKAAGLLEDKFGKFDAWRKRFAAALKVKAPAKSIVRISSAADLEKERAKVKKWLDESKCVLLVRENEMMPFATDCIYPLDIAIIDGYSSDGTWHINFPLGCDRGSQETVSGYHSADTLMVAVKDACLVYWSLPVSHSGKGH